MSIKKKLLEFGIYTWAKTLAPWHSEPKLDSILVIRPNDIGDLLVTTPIFQALKQNFPQAKIGAAIGSWNNAVLANNPYVDEVLKLNTPFHNKAINTHPWNSWPGLKSAIRYLAFSNQVKAIQDKQYSVGIDILGSHYVSALMLLSKIPYRLGVRGYVGGHSACQRFQDYDEQTHVGAFSLQFAKLLGAKKLPATTPQLFLTDAEMEKAQATWQSVAQPSNTPTKRIIIGPGAGFPEKRWPVDHFTQLLSLMNLSGRYTFIIVGSQADRPLAEAIQAQVPEVSIRCGQDSLRETFALTSAADLVMSNSSMLMHVAAAFNKNNVVLLGNDFSSASEHARLWGHGATSLVLGKGTNQPDITTPQEAFNMMKAKGWI